MRVGHLDGRGIVYRVVSEVDPGADAVNFAADLITEAGEEVLSVHPNVFFHITSGWGKTGGPIKLDSPDGAKSFFDSAGGVGSLFFTDRRIVFLRRPDPDQIRRTYYTPVGYPTAIADAWRAMAILSELGLEFVEVRFEDIVRITKKRKCYWLYIECQRRHSKLLIDERQMKDIRRFLEHRLLLGQ